MYQLYRDRPLLVACMVLANVALSTWCYYLDPVINFDGVIYTSVAQLLLDGQTSAAFDYYSWPFYSIFIATTSQLLSIDLEFAAFVLNTFFAISLTLAFVCIVAELSNNNRRTIFIAIVVILLFPSISKYRSFVIRDFGYLSCYLWSLYFIFRFCATQNKNHLIGWLVFAAISSLFRFEGIVFVLIAPYFLFLFGATAIPNRKKLLALLSVVIAVGSAALVFWYINDKYMDSVKVAGLAGKDIQNLNDLFIANIQARLGNQTFSVMSLFGLVIANTGDVAYELIRRMALFYFLFVLYAYVKRLTLNGDLQRKIWHIYVATNLLMLLAFSMTNNFLVSRYTMASVLTLLILAPFAIDRLFTVSKTSKTWLKLAVGFSILVLTVVSVEGLDVKTKKLHIKSAGEWINQNLPRDATVYSNNKLAVYYAKRGVAANLDHLYSLGKLIEFIKSRQIRDYDYTVIVGKQSNYGEDVTRQTLAYHFGTPIKVFVGEDGHFAHIYNTKPVLE